MNCPPEIADVILEILYTALIRIRAMEWSGNTTGYGVEADHVHNLPHLLKHYSPELLRYYWEIERPSFIARCPANSALEWFEPLWEKLWPAVEALPAERVPADLHASSR